MFQTGDLIIYGTTGVCKVTEIKEVKMKEMAESQDYYVLKPLYQECTISTPVDNDRIVMRPIISKKEAERLIDGIPAVETEAFSGQNIRELAAHYETILRAHDCGSLIELTMSIYEKKRMMESQKRKFGSVDGRFMKLAEGLLFGELAAALEISREEVPEYIKKRLHSPQAFCASAG